MAGSSKNGQQYKDHWLESVSYTHLFQGIDDCGEINTLGRGGSDTSAVALAIALDADVCEIYTDVDGVYTADPRVVERAWKMPEISYDEMLEMAAMGALVLQPRSVELAKMYGLKLHVRSSFNHNEGTIVKEEATMNNDLEKDLMVCGVAHDMNVLKATIFGVPDKPGIASSIFGKLADVYQRKVLLFLPLLIMARCMGVSSSRRRVVRWD